LGTTTPATPRLVHRALGGLAELNVHVLAAGTSVGQRRSGWPSPSVRCRNGLPSRSLLGSANDVAALHEC